MVESIKNFRLNLLEILENEIVGKDPNKITLSFSLTVTV